MTRLLAVLFSFGLLLGAAEASEDRPQVRLDTTHGAVVIALFPEEAPKTVDNFLRYVREGFYDGTIFHRVIEDFMIQGGGFTRDYTRKETDAPVVNEADNGLENERGTVAMARTSDPHSATSQFFINLKDNEFLDHRARTLRGWGYTVFGEVVEGMETVDRIAGLPTGAAGPFAQDVPREPVVIRAAEVVNPTDAGGR